MFESPSSLTKAIAVSAIFLLATAQSPAAVPTSSALVDRIGELLIGKYVDPALGRELADKLRRAHADGEFDAQDSPQELAALLTDFLRPYDRHFHVFHADAETPAASGPNAGEAWTTRSRRQNFGFRSIETRPGNVGYLDLRYFDSPAVAGATAAAAMQVLSQSDAVIIDLRQNGGGDPGMVQLLCSYFFAADDNVLLNSLYWREGDFTHQFWTLPLVPGPRLPDVPLYVLISPRTGSAAEEFAYNMKTQGRARLLGETTAGAANPGDVFEIGNGYSIFVSTGKAINPVTGDNWEGRGVTPDREVPADEADEAAYAEALDTIAGHASSPRQKRELDRAREVLQQQQSELRTSATRSPPASS